MKRARPAVEEEDAGNSIPLPSNNSGISQGVASNVSEEEEVSEIEKLRKEFELLKRQHEEKRRELHVERQGHAEALKRLAQKELSEEIDHVHAISFQLGHRDIHQKFRGGDDEECIKRLRVRIEEDVEQLKEEKKMLSKTNDDDKCEKLEILYHRIAHLTKEKNDLKNEDARLESARLRLLKRQRRLEAAKNSNFRNYGLMSSRYQPLNLLGHGGFGEVYRAYDTKKDSYCAIKIHEMDRQPRMTEDQRTAFVARCKRELEILLGLKHPHIVTMQDWFTISDRVLCFVLELCTGGTLDEYMHRFGVLSEKDARGIVIQVLSGLKYLNANETGMKIIHYDLKPANLLFQCGLVKIADFGLSKIVHQVSCGDSIDLTSPGTGTYWYLPPECNVEPNHEDPPKISNKVDVWSTGVIFFEMLSGKKPYGHGQSQCDFRRSAMAQGYESVELPQAVKVSPECREYVKRLMCLDKDRRPDVVEAASDPYISISATAKC